MERKNGLSAHIPGCGDIVTGLTDRGIFAI